MTDKPFAISAEEAWKERALEAERKLLDYEGKEMLYSGRTELAAFKKREPLVQEVITAFRSKPVFSVTRDLAIKEAVRKLAEFSP